MKRFNLISGFFIFSSIAFCQNYALNFDGSNDYVSIGNSINTGTSDFTISLWVRTDAIGSRQHIFQQTGDNGIRLIAIASDGEFHSRLSASGSDDESGFTASANTWYHVVIVHNNSGNTLVWYVNAVARNTNTSVNAQSASGNYYLGTNTNTDDYWFDGKMDEVAIWNDILTSSEISAIYNSGDGMGVSSNSGNYNSASNLQGYWNFQQNLNDESSNSNNGTFNGGSASYTDVSSDLSLPVELTSFHVLSTRSDAIILQWVTESEINNLGFILDRRVPGTEWTEIATYITHPELQGQGSVTHQTIYSYTDNTVLSAETYDYRLADVDYDGNKVYHSMTVMGVSPNDVVPETFTLYPAYPNPFNPVTTIRYDLPEDALVNITIYDIMGRSIRSLVNSKQTAGYRSTQWNATNDTGSPVSAGIYLYMIQAGEFRQAKKMVLLK